MELPGMVVMLPKGSYNQCLGPHFQRSQRWDAACSACKVLNSNQNKLSKYKKLYKETDIVIDK